ncbi:long-chain acyl-CoA synthetase [Parabacteroides sp. PF5-5]|uniref:AMP-binding protein n=1 Tax=unclassified Parabacteroides TaxID=2649774 RepID=UPI002476D995|nr:MULTISPECIES: AMP-binding protein [unclassified Parabacteroides]MDH6306631.1 long-chain acyl-CoA synthetase [Parabacteroides sp. PH5-39]MDH6317598.1 long-chain acyl-CoA synthetase [Parabacteroides sp. PF5-13]MDH6321342.1 long-chain acyl-CoA synthetase [Parabacteroides sp. PH5-13]MDH6325093.1 long-chain acyl-CoA synthetase [Parabacteroides sp. PH5-8]MDH6328802.1 long-chain acyl-CoA synthetase [Parabacteroides sp. PH5-41]
MIKENFIKLYEESFHDNWDLPALTDYSKGTTYTFKDVATQIARIHIVFDECQVRRGDKIALIGKDCSNWCIVYMAVVTYGAIIVPILQDFNPNDVHHIINHSDSTFLFVGDKIWDSLEEEKIENIRGVFSLSDYRCLHQRDGENIQKLMKQLDEKMAKKYPNSFAKEDIKYAELENDKVVLINYTSGTTGFSKGVMLTGNNLAGNVTYAKTLDVIFRGEKMLCFLPLAHAYSCAFNFLVPMAFGAHVYFLGKTPAPKILLKAFEEIKPNLIITVPLILEKIYKKMILPQLNKRSLKLALNIPLLDTRIYAQIRKHLMDAMGGRFREVIVGGAAMNQEVTDFLYKIKFPFTIGYGMTECGPLISYDSNKEFIPGSCGQVLKGIMEVRIDSDDPYNTVGEIQVKGENVMKGYYKNQEATENTFTEDGWLRTGDLGTINETKRIFIRGRSKTMILDSGGQNIYPEEIESKLNNLPFVMESIVIEKNGKLVGLVYPDYDSVDGTGLSHEDLPAVMEQNRLELNKLLAPYEHVSQLQLYPMEFEKTPKKSIKRYLYSNY